MSTPLSTPGPMLGTGQEDNRGLLDMTPIDRSSDHRVDRRDRSDRISTTLRKRPSGADEQQRFMQPRLSRLDGLVPAGVGVTAHLTTFGADGPALLAALVGSTVLAILAGVFAFLAVAQLTGSEAAEEPSDG